MADPVMTPRLVAALEDLADYWEPYVARHKLTQNVLDAYLEALEAAPKRFEVGQRVRCECHGYEATIKEMVGEACMVRWDNGHTDTIPLHSIELIEALDSEEE